MAQKSIHILNKNGCSMFWNSMWDDKINFTKSFKKQIFLTLFFEFLVEDYNSKNIFNKYKFFFKNYKMVNQNVLKKLTFLNFLEKSRKEYNYNNFFFNSKIWILKYQNWFIIFFFVFDSKKRLKNYKLNEVSVYDTFEMFLINTLKLNLNFNNYIYKNNICF